MDNGDVLLFSSDWEDGVPVSPEDDQEEDNPRLQRWQSLDPDVKKRIIKEQQAKAIMKKKKREPAQDKKRRMMMEYKKAKLKKKRQSRVYRPLPVHSKDRQPLSEFQPNSFIQNGTIISLTDFGVYVDVGTECDGLLHISQISSTESVSFVAHPRQVFSPGDVVENLYVYRVSPELKKLQLSMLTPEEREIAIRWNNDLEEEQEDEEEEDVERITLDELSIDDELWGEIKRVTNFGAYIELGAEVDGFLHFMDHPFFGTEQYKGAHPSAFMEPGQRVRVWVSNLDFDKCRIKLTAIRPESLPVLRREILY